MKMARLLGDTVFYEEKISQKRETRQNSTKITFYNQLDLIKSELSWFYFAYTYAYFVFLRAKTGNKTKFYEDYFLKSTKSD